MYQIINIPVNTTFPGKVTTEMLKEQLFKCISDNFELVMKITDVLEKPADFSNGNSWARTAKFNSHCWTRASLMNSESICRRFELRPEKKVHCLVFTDRETDSIIYTLQLLIPIKPNAVVLSRISGDNMHFMNAEELQENIDYRGEFIDSWNENVDEENPPKYDSFAEMYKQRPEDVSTLQGPFALVSFEIGYFGKAKDEPPIIEGILYVGEGKTMKIYHSGGGNFTDDSVAYFEIYDGDTLLHSGAIGNEPYDMDSEYMEDYVDNPQKILKLYKDYMMKHYEIDVKEVAFDEVNIDNFTVYAVSHN